MILVIAFATMATAGVVGFDDLTTNQPWTTNVTVQNAWTDVPLAYAGMSWIGWEVMNRSAYNTLYGQSEPTLPSDPNFAYSGNDSGGILTVTSADPFNFLGTQLSYWPGASGAVNSVTITGWLGSVQVGQVTTNLSAGWTNSGGINGVDKLVFAPANGVFRMDNLETESGVPEPASITMISGGGLLLLMGALRRRRQGKT